MKKLSYLIAVLILAANSFAQGHFVVAFTGNGQDHMNIFLVTASIGGEALEAGDEIAAFDGTICCGKIILKQSININNNNTFIDIKASRKDDGFSNGYTIGNTITYKFWNSKKDIEISGITAEYFNPSTGLPTHAPTYSESGSAFVKLTVPAPINRSAGSNAGSGQSVNHDENVNIDTIGSIEKRANSELKAKGEISTEIDPIFRDQKITVYPNPTSGKIKVVFDRIIQSGTYLTVNDLMGKTIQKQFIQNKEEWIDLKGNAPGVYLIETNLNNMKVQKVILK